MKLKLYIEAATGFFVATVLTGHVADGSAAVASDGAEDRPTVFAAQENTPKGEHRIDLLITQLKSRNEYDRFRAAVTLGRIGPGATAALPALREALQDSDPYVRAEVEMALRRIEEAARGPAAEILLRLADGTAEFSGRIAESSHVDSVRKTPCAVFEVRLVRGETYQIDMTSREIDPFLRLEDRAHRELASDDDGGGNLNARIVFEAPESGAYRIIATTFTPRFGAFALTVRAIRGAVVPGGAINPQAPDPPVAALMSLSRTVLSHGRHDSLRRAGYASPDNKLGQAVPAVTALLAAIAAEPQPRAITLGLNPQGTGPIIPGAPNPVLAATAELPSSMTLLVAELGLPALGQTVKQWHHALPRFGNGNFYASVTLPEVNIAAGQELLTSQHFKDYTANSILWEAPDFGNVVVARQLEGGTTNLGVTIARGKNVSNYSYQVGWANPLELELAEAGQQRIKGSKDRPDVIRLTIQATLPASFEPNRLIRWSAETRKGTMIGESPASVVRPNRTTTFTIGLPGDIDGMVSISAVASPGPFVRSLGDVQSDRTVGLSTFHSQAPTLEDTISVFVKKDDIDKTISDKLDQANAKSGDVQVSLYWTTKDDLDLLVVAPSGEEIYYGHRNSRCDGHLDVDMNVQYANAVSGAVENIYWPKGKAPRGKYKVYVTHYSHHGNRPGTADPASFEVRILVRDLSQVHSQRYSGSVSNADPKRRKVLVHEFELR